MYKKKRRTKFNAPCQSFIQNIRLTFLGCNRSKRFVLETTYIFFVNLMQTFPAESTECFIQIRPKMPSHFTIKQILLTIQFLSSLHGLCYFSGDRFFTALFLLYSCAIFFALYDVPFRSLARSSQ